MSDSRSTTSATTQDCRRPLVIFDFDGTLADTFTAAFDHLFTETFPKYHIHIKRQDLDKWRNKSIAQIFFSLPFSFWKLPKIMIEVKKWHDQHLELVPLFPGVPEMIKTLHDRDVRLMILTSNSVENVQKILHRDNLEHYFADIQESKGLFNKPQGLRNLINKYEVTAREIIYVGDEIRDIKACKQAGVPIVAVTYGFNGTKSLRRHRPQFLVDSPQEVVEAITGICLR